MAIQRLIPICLLVSGTVTLSATQTLAGQQPTGKSRPQPAGKSGPQPAFEQEFSALSDEFKKAMPEDPKALRDPAVRAKVAPTVMPIIQKMVECLERRAKTDKSVVGNSAKYQVLAMALGNDQVKAKMTTSAQHGDRGAKVQLAASKIIVAADASQRKAAIDDLVAVLGGKGAIPPGAAAAALRAVLYAGAPSKEELEQISDTVDSLSDRMLKEALDRALRTPDQRRAALNGKPLILAGRLLTGQTFSTASLKGKVILVHFWASWCPACRRSLPSVTAARNTYRSKGLMVVGVSCDHAANALRQFLAQNPEVNWPQLFNTAKPGWHELAEQCGIASIPVMFLIDRQGVVRSVDARDHLEERVRDLVNE